MIKRLLVVSLALAAAASVMSATSATTRSAAPTELTRSAGPAELTRSAGPAELTRSAGPAELTGSAQTVNCVAAIVSGQIITRLDVEITAAFGLAGPAGEAQGGDARLAALDSLIDQKIVLDLAREARTVGKDEIAAVLADVRRALGEEGFRSRLARFGLTAKDLEPYLEDLVLYERALALRFSQSIPVSVTEVERHYRDIYVPEQARRGVPAEPLERVSATIETKIREDRRTQQTSVWVRDLRKTTDIQIRKDCLK